MAENGQPDRDPVVEEARALREVAAKLEAHVALMVSQEVRASAVPKEKFKTGLLTVLLLSLLFAFALVAWNRVTLQQAQRRAQVDLTAQIVGCFLRPRDASRAQAEECARRNGGDLYRRQQRESAEAVKRFVDLQRWAVEQGWKPPPPPEE